MKEVFERIAELVYRTKVLNIPIKNTKLISKPYQGKTIGSPIPKNIQHPPKKRGNVDSLFEPDWLDRLDNLRFGIEFFNYQRKRKEEDVEDEPNRPRTNTSKKEKKKKSFRKKKPNK